MPDATAEDIRDALETQLDAVTELKGGVEVGRTANFNGFPAARFYFIGYRDQKADQDTDNDYRVLIYSIDIVMSMQIDGVTKEASEDEFQDAVWGVIDRLHKNWTLAGTVEQLSIEPSQVRYEDGSQGVVTYLPLVVEAKTLVSIS